MWGNRKNSNTIVHIKTASDASSATLDDNYASSSTHHRRQSSSSISQFFYYYVQSPTTQHSSGSTRIHQSTEMPRSNAEELVPIWDGGDDEREWEKVRLEDSLAQENASGVQGRRKGPIDQPGYYSEFRNGSVCSGFVRVMAAFVVVFTAAVVVLWGMGRINFKPRVLVQDIVFIDLDIQEGVDLTGVPTEMISLNSTVRVMYKKPATLFGIHFSSSPFILHHYDLKLASSQMEKLYQSRKREEKTTRVVVQGNRMPIYGGITPFLALKNHPKFSNEPNIAKVKIGLNLTFSVRAKANILGKLINHNFFKRIRCPLTLDGALLGKPINLTHSCIYL